MVDTGVSRRDLLRLLHGCALAAVGCGRDGPTHVGWPFAPPRVGPDPDAVFAWAFDTGAFEPLPPPQRGDWLAEHEEPGQDVVQFLADEPNVPKAPRDAIVIQPIGEGDVFAGMLPGAEEIVDYLECFFGLRTVLRDPIGIDPKQLGVRHHQGHLQWNATDINEALREILPAHAYCCIGVTKVDLFPEPEWNFVFGQANLTERVGVFSLARYDAAFFGLPPSEPSLVRRRGLGVVAHEVGHMFGMQHCVHHKCLMNGSNNQDESDRTPLHVCAICLRKLHLLVGFDPKDRYTKLERFYREHELIAEAAWVAARLADAPKRA
jgi:archaemetzincin